MHFTTVRANVLDDILTHRALFDVAKLGDCTEVAAEELESFTVAALDDEHLFTPLVQ